MSTLNELAYNVMSSIKPHLSDDEDISIRKIKFDIISERSTMIRNEMNKNRTVDDAIIQDLGCVELEEVDQSLCPELPVGTCIKRTVKPLPVPIELHNRRLITRISNPVVLSESFPLYEYNKVIHTGNRKFSKDQVQAFFKDGHIYLKSTHDMPFIKFINVRGVFEDPTDVADFFTESGEACYDANSDFPMNNWMNTYVLNKLKDIYMKVDLQMPQDSANDAFDKDTSK